FSSLASFNGTNGLGLKTAPIQGRDGNFYGTAPYGGIGFVGGPNPSGFGTVFSLTRTGDISAVYFFGSIQTNGYVLDGYRPSYGLTEGPDSCLYGTTFNGGMNGQGTFFRLSTTVTPRPSPVLQLVSTAGGQLIFSWNASSGQVFQLQYKSTLSQTNWTNLDG